jgi:predicted nucleic acid-binding protein
VDRVFLDANVLFSAAYRHDAGLRQLFKLRRVTLITSAYAVEEARRNLTTSQQRKDLEQLCSSIEIASVVAAELLQAPGVDLPESDRPILAAAISARATHLVTGDVKDFGRYYGQMVAGVLILPPAEYLRIRREEKRS